MASTRRKILAAGAAATAALYTGCRRRRAPADAANVLVIVIDTLRADYAYGPRAPTPNLDRLMAEGLTFTRAFPEAMPTVPARNSILSGRRVFPFRNWHDYPGLLDKPGWEPLPDVGSAFTSVMRRAGWWTGYVTDNPFLGFSAPYDQLRRSFDLFVRHGGQIGGRYGPVPTSSLQRWLHPAVVRAGKEERVRRYIANADYARDERRSFAAQVFTSAAEALRRAARDPRPFALVVDAYEPHEPWTPPRKYTDLLGDPGYRGPEPAMPAYDRVEAWLTPDEADVVLERLRVLYAAEVAMTDRWLGVLLERLHDLRLDRDTIVALISDHGVQLGEHGWTGKIASALHPELIQVPFVIVDPRIRPTSIRSDYFASTHDLAPTVLSMAGARGQFQTDGSDLSTIFHGVEPPSRPEAYGGYSDHHFLRSGRWAYTCDNRLERPRLYDLSGDAGELLDVAAEQPDVVEELGELIRERIGGAIPDYS